MKYIIDICDEPINHVEGLPKLYKAKNFNSLVFDEEDLKRLTPCIERSILDNQFIKEQTGWELARRILWGYDGSEIIEMFSNNDRDDIIRRFSYREAKTITDGYDNHRRIEQDVAKILETKQECLYKTEANKCTGDCRLCDCHVADDETIRALSYVLSMLRER